MKRNKDIPEREKARSHGYCCPYRQWGTILLNSEKGKIILPISAKVYVIVLQHYGSAPQYNGVDNAQNVSSSLKDEEEIRFIAITK